MFEKSKKMRGFTLIELMIVIAIFSILVLAMPNFGRIIADQRLKGCARDIYSNMQKAKLEAIKQNTTVAVKFISAVYTPQGSAGSYTVFIDNGAGAGGIAGNLTQDGAESTVISITMPKKVTMVNASFSGGTSSAGFNSRGLPANSRSGNIQVRNSTRWYRIKLSIAGGLQMTISGDGGTTWQ